MSYIRDVAREALQTASSDIVRARRTLVLVVGILALIHVLTVYPYLLTSKELVRVENDIAENAALLAGIEPEIRRLREAGERANVGLIGFLDGVTEEMIGRFEDLRIFVQRALDEEIEAMDPNALDSMMAPPVQRALPGASAPPQFQIQQALPPGAGPPPQLQTQQIGPPDPVQFPQAQPLPGQPVPPGFAAPRLSPGAPPDDLKPILKALTADEDDAYDRLIEYARNNIVAAAYARADREWNMVIKPAYLDVLDTAAAKTIEAAESALPTDPAIASSLEKAAVEMARQRAAVEAIEIRHDANVDTALGTDWWRTVEGKGVFADAVSDSINRQMMEIADVAAAPTTALQATLALQERFQQALRKRQEDLEAEFASQRDQLTALSGARGVIPVKLSTFIGVFPLVLGLALGFVMLRAGQARRQAALAAEDLARYAPEERETILWLSRRALGGGAATGPLLLMSGLAIGAIAWIGLAASQVAESPVDPPLSASMSGGLAAVLVLVAAAWESAAIRRLAKIAERRDVADEP